MKKSRKDTDPAFRDLYPSDDFKRVEVTVQGDVLELKVKEPRTALALPPRGAITDLSRAARMRMLKHFQKIDFAKYVRPIFMSLTYPDEVSYPTYDERRMHLAHMARALERITKKTVPAAWRMEWEDRQTGTRVGQYAPHWHLLIFRHNFIDKHAVNDAWRKVIKWKGYCRTETRRVKREGIIQMYMAKYISKSACPLSLVYAAYCTKLGKQYGWLRKDEIPMQPLHEFERLTSIQRADIVRLAEEQIPWMGSGLEGSFTLFGDSARDALRILHGEVLDDEQ